MSQEIARSKDKGEAITFVLHLAISVLLMLIYFSIRNILLSFIDDKFEAPETNGFFFSGEYGKQAANLLLSFLAFISLYIYEHKLFQKNIVEPRSFIRRAFLWCVAIISLISAFGDATSLLSGFFTGEIGAHALLQTLVTLVLALLFLGFASIELKIKQPTKRSLIAVILSFGLPSSAAIMLALYQAPPWEQKLIRQDLSRMEALNQLHSNIDAYFLRYLKLPASLPILVRELALTEQAISDPFTQAPFKYEITGRKTFKLCAVFHKDAKSTRRISNRRPFGKSYHAGLSCINYLITLSNCQTQCLEDCAKKEASRD